MANKKFLNPINLVNLASDPASASEGDIYYNTTDDAIKVYADGFWVAIVSGGGIEVSTTAPLSPITGDGWYKNDTGEFYIYDGTYWVEVNGVIEGTNSFKTISVSGQDSVVADSFTDTLSLIAGTNVSITTDATADSITINADSKSTSSVYLVRNNTESTILKGTLVSASGAEPSGRIDVEPFAAVGGINSEITVMGMATANISSGVNGEVISFGTLTGIDTRGSTASAIAVGDETWAEGDILFAHPTVAGKLTKVRPQHDLAVAFITVRHASTGQIAVRIVPGNNHLEWMHDVLIDGTPADNEVLAYNSGSGVWINQTSIEAGLIDTSATAQTKAGDLTITGTGSFNNATVTSGAASSSTTTGALKVDGGVGVTGNIYAGGNLVITGNLTVSGDTTTLNTATLDVEDNIITLNSGVTGSPTLSAGVEVNRGTSTDVSLKWDESLDKWTTSYDLNGNKDFAITEVLTFQAVNDNGSTISPLDPTFISGVDVISGTVYIEKMSNNTEKFFGFTTSSVLDETKCVVVTRGLVTGVDTSSYSNGDILYISSSGTLTTTKPSGIYVQKVAKVLHSNASGSLYVYGHESILPNLSNGYVWAGNSTSIPTETLLNTANVPELTNLYFTDERAQDAIGTNLGSGLSYNDSTGAISNSGVLSIIGTANEIDILGTNTEIQIGIPNSPTFVTPNIGVATATSVNGTTIPSSKTLVVTTDIGTSVQAYDADLNAIASLTGTSGILTTNGSGTWSVDTNTYSTTSHNHSLDGLSNVVITGTPTDGQAIVWDTTTSKWVNETVSGGSASYPTQSGNNGKFLQTDGSTVSWQNVDLSGYQPLDQDLTDIAALSSNGFLKKTAGVWAMDTSTYLTSESDTLSSVTSRGATTSDAITISNTTQSTTPTTGALIISGGIGIAKDVWIDGDLHVNGTTATLFSRSLSTRDNLIYLNESSPTEITNAVGDGTYVTYTADNDYLPGESIRITGIDPAGYNISSGDLKTIYSATDTQFVVEKTTTGTYVSGGDAYAKSAVNPDLGFAGGYNDGTYAHAGLFRDASDGVFKFFKGYTPEPDSAVNIDTTHASFELADISANDARFTGNVTIGEAVVKTTVTSFASSSATTIASFPYGEGANAIDCMVLVTGDNIQTVSKLMISSGGEGVFLTEYSIINSGFYESPLTFTVSLSSGNIILQATGGDEYTTTKVYSSQINGESFAS